MSTAENRQALRIPCTLPIRVGTGRRFYRGTIRDVSRTGLRIWIPSVELGAKDDSLLVLARLVDDLLGTEFQGELHYEMLGPLVRKRLKLVRLGHSATEPAVELGCLFKAPLSDDETVMLGLGLPAVGVTEASAYRDVPRPRRRGTPEEAQPAAPRPKAFDAVLHPSDGHAAEPLAGETSGMDATGALVTIERTPELAGADLPALTVRIADAYGPAPKLEILDGLRMLWTGPVDIRRVEVPAADRVLLHMAGSD